MGQSKSIEEKLKDDEEFRKFMKSVEQESIAEENRILTEIEERVKKHYEGNDWKYSRFFGDKRSDYQNYDDWSLARVNNIIESIGNAIDNGDYPSKEVPG
ncbi:MAG: hypothetical protein MI975_25705, partial [Cytophagales bacterium]|nr:hypothetical protein [Cytophagales bacterium]